jgi:hypothetical protein
MTRTYLTACDGLGASCESRALQARRSNGALRRHPPEKVKMTILSFIKIAAGRNDPGAIGGNYSAGGNRIELFLLGIAHERAIETAIHETGHAVDWHAGSSGLWSASSGGWLTATGWRHNAEYGFWTSSSTAGAPTPYASRGGAIEHFAETSTWYVERQNRGSGGYSEAIGRPSPERQDALNVALGELR